MVPLASLLKRVGENILPSQRPPLPGAILWTHALVTPLRHFCSVLAHVQLERVPKSFRKAVLVQSTFKDYGSRKRKPDAKPDVVDDDDKLDVTSEKKLIDAMRSKTVPASCWFTFKCALAPPPFVVPRVCVF